MTPGDANNKTIMYRQLSSFSINEQSLTDINLNYTTLLGNLPGMAYRCTNTTDWKMEFVSSGCKELTGYSSEDLINNNKVKFVDLIALQDREQVWQTIQAGLAERRSYSMVYQMLTATGERRWVQEQGRGIFDGDTLQALEGIIIDITQLRETGFHYEHINSVLFAIRKVNQLITREKNYETLLQSACDIMAEIKDYNLVGIVIQRHPHAPVETCEAGNRDLINIFFTEQANSKVREIFEFAINTDEPLANLLYCTDEIRSKCPYVDASCQGPILERIQYKTKIYGFLSVFPAQGRIQIREERELLSELASDIAHGLHDLETEAQHLQILHSLEQTEERQRLMLEIMQDGVAIIAPDGKLSYSNNRFWEILGIADCDRANANIFDLLYTKAKNTLLEYHLQSANQSTRQFEVTWHHQNGGVVHTLVSLVKLQDTGIDMKGSFISITDITDLKNAHKKLEHANATLSAIINSAPLAIAAIDENNNITVWNEAAQKMFGWTRAEVIGKTIPTFSGVRDTFFSDQADVVRKTALIKEVEVERQRRDGSPILLSLSAAKIQGTQEVMAVVMDITHRRKIETALRQNEKRFRQMTDMLPDMLYEADKDLYITYANQAIYDQLGYTPEDLTSRIHATQLVDAEAMPDVLQHIDALKKNLAPTVGIWHVICKDGSVLPVEIHTQVLYDDAGNFQGMRGVMRDVSDRERAAEAQRLASVGQLAAGVAHEFNNLLAAMSGKAQLAELMENQKAYDSLIKTVIRGSERGAEISRKLMDFARPSEPRQEPACIEIAVETALSIASNEIAHNHINVIREYEPDTPLVMYDLAQMEQAFLNIILNAVQVMPGGGILSAQIIHHKDETRDEIIVRLTDTGPGIKPEHMSRLFEPFFTVSPEGLKLKRGTGLGLPVAHGIITAHKGTIKCFSEPGSGATFEIHLQVYQGTFTQESKTDSNGYRILVVDDERDVRDILYQMLTHANYEVVTTGTFTDALKQLNKSKYDLVISDLNLPENDGMEIISAVAEINPKPRIIIITGMSDSKIIKKLLQAGASAVLTKPFSLKKILNSVRQVISDEHQISKQDEH